MGGSVHYELYIRRLASDGWTLHGALAERTEALAQAESLVEQGRAVAARVSKEVLDEGSGLFSGVVIHTFGAPEPPPRRAPARAPDAGPPCGAPADLYTPRARELLARLLEDWLARRRVTVFELLHRPDLAEALEAHGDELAGAVQRVAIPEAQATGRPVHEVMRRYRALAAAAAARLAGDARRRAFPDLEPSNFAVTANRLAGRAEAAYLLGGGVAAFVEPAAGWRAKLEAIVALSEAAPEVGPGRALALAVLEPPLSELLGGRAPLPDLVGRPLDLGEGLAFLARLSAGRAAAALEAADAGLLTPLPPLDATGARLEALLAGAALEKVRAAVLRRVLAEVAGPRRLRPADPQGEIELLRALASVLGAAAGPRLPLEEVRAAFIERSRRLVAADFTEALTAGVDDPVEVARALVRLAENVTGAANKRAAVRWIEATVTSLRFETAARHAPGAPGARLAGLAALQRALGRADLDAADVARLAAWVGEVGGRVEADTHLVQAIGRSAAPLIARASALLQMAAGEAAPRGAAADRARAEALRLMREPQFRREAAAEPDGLARLKALLAA